MVGDHPEAAPVSGVKRKVMLPEAVVISNAGSGLCNKDWGTKHNKKKHACAI